MGTRTFPGRSSSCPTCSSTDRLCASGALCSARMCGRVTLTKSGIREIADELEAEVADEDVASYRPRHNVAPTDTHWMLERGGDRRVLLPAVWGYVTATGRPLINV